MPPRATLLRHLPLALRSSGIGVVIGALPGTGGDIAAPMLGFGIAGCGLRRYGLQPGPIILGMILGPLMDASWRRAVIAAGDAVPQAAVEAAQSAISRVLLAAIALIAVSSFFGGKGRSALSP